MNKIYKVVWNTVRNCYVVGSELISSKSGRHSTSNGKSSSLKVTLTVLALCGMTALGSGVAPAYAADAGTAVASQYVAVLVNSSNNYYTDYWGRRVQYGDDATRTFDGHSYHKETVSGETYWVRDGYSIKYEENERYPGAQKDNIIKAYKTSSYTTASDEGLLKSNQIMVESAGISTLTGVDLDNVSGGTYVGATNSGSTSTPSSFNYMIKDDNGTYVDAGNTNFSKRFKAATKNTDGTYSYNGEVIANDNLYVVNEQVGVFLTSSGKVYTGKVFGANNEVLMTTKSDEGTMYSYWGADTPDPNTKLADMTIGQFNQALEKVNNNSKAVAGDTIKEIKTTAKTEGGTDGGTIDFVRRGQYNSATGQYEGEYTVGDGITITSHGGTNGEDVKINFSNGTTGFDVAAGSKVEAVGTKEATTGLKINGETYNIKTGQTYTEGDNITIDGNKISATDTTLVDGKAEKKGDSYIVKDTAGNEVTLEDVASANKLTEVNNQVTENTQNITKNTTNITELGKQLKGAVMYDSTDTGFNKNNVTLGGTPYDSTTKTGGTKITNLARGTNDSDAVNFSQLSEVKDAENYVISGSLSKTDGTITLNRLKDGPVTITGLNDYVKGIDSYVTNATLNGNTLTLTRNQGLGSLTVDLSSLTEGLSKSDYRVVANPAEGSDGIYTPDDKGNIELTVEDTNTGATSTIKLSDIASATTVTNNYNTLDTKIDNTRTDITNEYNTAIDNAKTEIQNDYNTKIDAAKTHYFSVNASGEGNYNNDGAGNLSIAIGANTSATEEATAVGNNSTADERSAAFGYSSDARGTRAVAIGAESSTNGTNSTAIGQKAVAGYYKSDDDQVQAESATAVGSQAEVLANYGTAVGESAKVLSENGTAIGKEAQIWENSAKGVAVGQGASVGSNGHAAEYGVALGANSYAEAEKGIAIGYNAVVSQPNSVALGSYSTTNPVVKTSSITIPNTNATYHVNGTDPVGTVSVGSATGLRTITNVAAGRVSEASTDAVNGSELYAVATEAAKHTTITTEEGSRITVDSKTNSAGGTEYILDFDSFGLANSSLNNLTNQGKTVITNLAKEVERHIKPDTYAVDNDGTVTMTYVNGKGETVNNMTATITGIAKSNLSNITEEGDTVINNIAKNAVKVINGKNTTVTEGLSEDGKTKTYAVNVDNATIQAATDVTGENGISVTSAVENGVKKYKVSAKLSNNFAIDQATGNIDLAPSISVGNTNTVTINGNTGEITGLSNKTTTAANFADGSGRAATEEQLSAMQSGLTAADKYVTSGTIDKANGTMKLTVANVSTPVSITGLTDYQVMQDGSGYDAENHRLTLNLKDTMNTSNPAQSVTFDGIASTTDVAKATTAVEGGTNIVSVDKTTGTNGNDIYTVNAKGTTVSTDDNFVLDTTAAGNNVTNYGLSLANSITIGKGESSHPIVIDGNKGEITGLTNKTLDAADFATVGRAATEEQLKEVNSKATAAKTTVTAGKNIAVNGTSDENGSAYTVALADDVSLGNNAIQLNGSNGSISATSGTSSLNFNDKGLSLSNGKNSTVINGGTITVNGGDSVISGTQATFGKIKLNAESGSTITGLTNTTTKYDGFATVGRAATEEQLKEVAGQAGEAIETAGKGWNLTTNGKEASKTNIKPDGTVDFSSSNDNLVISNAGADLSFSLSDNLDLTKNDSKKGSVKVGENTTLTDELLQVGKDVSLTASALRVGASSLTTDALMVGGLTYINSNGLNANNRVISNVAAGILDTDAVNVGQLKSAISGSQVSIKAGDGISVAKTGNQYTINVNIEGVTNNQGKVTVSTGDSTSTESGSESGSSGAKKFRVMDLMYRAESNEVAPETTTDTGKAIQIESIPEDIKLEADDNQAASVVNGETIKIAGDGTNISTTATVTGSGSKDTISVSLKPDIQVDSVTINNGGPTINNTGIDMNGKSITNVENIAVNNGPTINSSGIDMNSQKITNLADGEIAEGSTDAVNGGQLYNTNQAVIANAENINSLSHSLNKLDSRINRVGAGAAALAALHPLDFDPDNKWDFAAGYGNYAGANAVAIGTYYRPNENTMFSIGGSFGGGENMINAGVSFKLGSGGSGITTSKTVMAKKIKEQDELLKAQDAKMKEQDEKIAKLEALVAQQGEMIQQALGKK